MHVAYLDGELDDRGVREIEAEIAHDPEAQAGVWALRDSAALARAAYAQVLHEPVPERLLAAASGHRVR